LQRYLAPRELDAVLLTHLHADHCLDVCGLYVALRYDPTGTRSDLMPIYGPSGTLRRLIDAYGPEHEGSLERVFAVAEWTDGDPVAIGPFRVLPLRVNHPVEAYGLRIEAPDGTVLAYTGDTDTCPSLIPLASGADLLLAEAAFQEERDDAVRGVHLTGRRAGQVAVDAGARRLVLTHLPVWNDAKVALIEAAAVYSGPTEVAVGAAVYQI
jgi:ribonuclease BN (tRNA processing enzyme)